MLLQVISQHENDLDPAQVAQEIDQEILAFEAESSRLRQERILHNTPTQPPTSVTKIRLDKDCWESWGKGMDIPVKRDSSGQEEKSGITKRVENTTKFTPACAHPIETNFEELD